MRGAKELSVLSSGFLGFIIPTYFAWTVYKDNIPQNIATWSMILILDVLGIILVYKAGNKKPIMQLGWLAAAICIVLAITFSNNPWHWGVVESLSLILCGVAVMLWFSLNPRIAIWAYIAAAYISFVPLMMDYWDTPQPETLWLWLGSIIPCLLSIYGAEKRDFANTIVPWTAIAFNVLISVLCIS